MIRIGDKIRKKIYFGSSRGASMPTEMATGVVVYIHPQQRYYVLQFKFGTESFCESYTLDAGGD